MGNAPSSSSETSDSTTMRCCTKKVLGSKGAGVPVYVMLPLDSLQMLETPNGKWALRAALLALNHAGVEGIMVDVWWGIVEKDAPGDYHWSAYSQLLELVISFGLKVQAVMSFHQCGGNVGDSCRIPLPKWVVDEIDSNPDIVYTDKSFWRNYEYISLGCDLVPVLGGRTPVQVYADFMSSFRENFRHLLGDVIVEIQVGMGPAGELRYPSYPEAQGMWAFPGIGEFQCYDKYLLADLKARAESVGKGEWGAFGGPGDGGGYNQQPDETEFFRDQGTWCTAYGQFFLDWYSGLLLAHGERLLSAAHDIFKETGADISGKVSGIHWQYCTSSHAAEITAGYYNTEGRDGYYPLASMFAKFDAILNFTCIEMKDEEQPLEARSSPESLIAQVAAAARRAGIRMSGENALPRFDEAGFDQMIRQARLGCAQDNSSENEVYPLCCVTYLRMCEQLYELENWTAFASFVRQMGEATNHKAVDGLTQS